MSLSHPRLKELKVTDLKQLCQEYGIPVGNKPTKAKLVELIEKQQERQQLSLKNEMSARLEPEPSTLKVDGASNSQTSAQQSILQHYATQNTAPAQQMAGNGQTTPRHESSTPSTPIHLETVLKEEQTSDQDMSGLINDVSADEMTMTESVSLKLTPNDTMKIVVNRKELANQSLLTESKSSPLVPAIPQFYQRVSNIQNTTNACKYDQLYDVVTSKSMYEDGEIPHWLKDQYDTAGFIVVQQGIPEEDIFCPKENVTLEVKII